MLEGQRRRATRMDRQPRSTRESGQALLELALVTPLLVLLLMAIFQFAFVIQSQVGLTNAVRESARRVAATCDSATCQTANPVPDWAALETWVQAQLCGDATPPCTGGLLDENVQAFDGTKLWADPPDVSFCSYSIAGITNYRVQADVKYKHPVFFGLLEFATDLVDGEPNGFWDLSASARMRLENIDDSDPLTFVDPGQCPA